MNTEQLKALKIILDRDYEENKRYAYPQGSKEYRQAINTIVIMVNRVEKDAEFIENFIDRTGSLGYIKLRSAFGDKYSDLPLCEVNDRFSAAFDYVMDKRILK